MELMKGYKQTERGAVPIDWELREFGELTEKIIGGGTPSRSNRLFWGNEIPWVTVKDFATFNGFQTQEYITKDGLNNSASHLIPKGILITSTRMALGKAVIYNVDVSINQDLKAIFLKKTIDTNFFYYWFQSNSKFIEELGSGSTVMGLSLPDLRKIKVKLPPTKSEQTAIATALSDADALISSLEKLIEKKRNIKQGVMQELLNGKRRLNGFRDKWAESDIASLCLTFTKQTGFDYSAYIKPSLVNKYEKGTIPFIQNKDFNGFYINFETDYFVPEKIAEAFPRILLNEKCLLISISGSIGRVAVFSNFQKAFIGGAVAVGKFKDKSLLEWVLFNLQSQKGQDKLFINVKQGSHQNLILDDIRKIKIPIPSREERDKIVMILTDIENELLSLEKRLAKVKMLKQGMMRELLTGKIRLI